MKTIQAMNSRALRAPAGPRHVRPSVRCRFAPDPTGQVQTHTLKARELTSWAFKPFGQVIEANYDGKTFDKEDAQLEGFNEGTPRFYIMRLQKRGLTFNRITYHEKVTQVLGSLHPTHPWYIVVSKPTGSIDKYPKESEMIAFCVPPGKAIKLHKGTWHAGPLFVDDEHMEFYNLEHSNTNLVDHNTHDFKRTNHLQFEVVQGHSSAEQPENPLFAKGAAARRKDVDITATTPETYKPSGWFRKG